MRIYASREFGSTHICASAAPMTGRASQGLRLLVQSEDLPDLKTVVKLLKDII